MDRPSRLSISPRDESEDGLLGGDSASARRTTCSNCNSRRRPSFSTLLPWMLSTVLLACLVILTVRSSQGCTKAGFWRNSEFGESAPRIYWQNATRHKRSDPYQATVTRELSPSFREVRFDATLKYNESHQVYRPVTYPPYVGAPSPEIDTAWENLLGGKSNNLCPCESDFI